MGKGAFYTGKLALFLLKTVLVVVFVGLVLYVAFHTAMNIGSVYVLSTEGMELRADVALGAQSESELVNYFTQDWLERDALLQNNPYADYKITGYGYSLKVENMTAWAWSDTATVVVTEQVSRLAGVATDGSVDAEGNALTPPAWEECRHTITLKKNREGRWYIAELATETIQETETDELAAITDQ